MEEREKERKWKRSEQGRMKNIGKRREEKRNVERIEKEEKGKKEREER